MLKFGNDSLPKPVRKDNNMKKQAKLNQKRFWKPHTSPAMKVVSISFILIFTLLVGFLALGGLAQHPLITGVIIVLVGLVTVSVGLINSPRVDAMLKTSSTAVGLAGMFGVLAATKLLSTSGLMQAELLGAAGLPIFVTMLYKAISTFKSE